MAILLLVLVLLISGVSVDAQTDLKILTVAPDGGIWYANFGNSRIGRIGR